VSRLIPSTASCSIRGSRGCCVCYLPAIASHFDGLSPALCDVAALLVSGLRREAASSVMYCLVHAAASSTNRACFYAVERLTFVE
jgi:hypothetical protein